MSEKTSSRLLWERTLSASCGAFLTSLLVTPFDVVKVRMQAQAPNASAVPRYYVFNCALFDHVDPVSPCPGSKCKHSSKPHAGAASLSRGTWADIRRIRESEGVVALYRGFLPTLVMAVPATVVYFVGYETLRDGGYAPTIAGGGARILAVTAISPLELVKTRMQHRGASLRTVLSDVAGMLRAQGVAFLWRGLVPTLYRDVPFSALYWHIIETLRPPLRRLFSSSAPSAHPSTKAGEFAASFVAGTVAGALSAAATVPFDVAKTRYQLVQANLSPTPTYASASPTSVWQCLWRIGREEGWRGLTAGIVPRVCKVAPACAIMISSYEVGKRLLT